jgi:hypothetical protein
MMDQAEDIIKQGSNLFSKRLPVMSLWQTLASNFYPERADFTASLLTGDDFASNLMTSYPILARRDLGNAFSSMLRPSAKDWFHIRSDRIEKSKLQLESNNWLEAAAEVMRKLMYNRNSGFVRATKQADHDFAAFGQTVISTELNKDMTGLLYRCWHLRDVCWMTDENDMIDTIYRRWKPTARDICKLWPGKVHDEITKCLEKEPFREWEIWHVVCKSDLYNYEKKMRTPYVSYYIDVEHKKVMECTGSWTLHYTIPRWQLVSGSQYAFSPATITALPDARLIQSMTGVLLESGERAANPPLLAVQEALRSDVSVYPGGITYLDGEYDERLGPALRPLLGDSGNLAASFNMSLDTREMIKEAFYLSKLTLPQPGRDMTAYEVGQRVQEYIRQAMPIFEPMETEYNGALCEQTFEILLRGGAFGPMRNIPRELQGETLSFAFESPLHDAVERAKGQTFLESKSLLAEAVDIDPGSVHVVDIQEALRDVLGGIGIPSKWLRSKGEVDQRIDAQQRAQQEQQRLMQAEQIAKTAQNAGVSAKDFINPAGG